MFLDTVTSYIIVFILVLFSLLCSPGDAKLAPDYIHPCNVDNWNTCLVESTQFAVPKFVKGIPALGITVLDPFDIDKLPIPISGLNVTFYKGKLSGFRNCIVDEVKSELEKRHFVLAFHCNLTIRGQYSAKGQLLVFPINGAGDAKIKLTNLQMRISFDYKFTKGKDGHTYSTIDKYTFTFDYGDKMTFDLKNLFKDSPELSATVVSFLNENWRTVAEEFGKPIVDYAVDLAVNSVGKFFQVVPFEELVDRPIPDPV